MHAAERSKDVGRKLKPVVVEADTKVVGKYLDDVPGGVAGEQMILKENFDKIPKDAFQNARKPR